MAASTASSLAATPVIQGKLWVVPVGVADLATFPAPSAIPDATFETDGIAYVATTSKHCYTIGSWLGTCSTLVKKLTFSNISNPALGGPANAQTAMSGPNASWGVIIEYTGIVNLEDGQDILIEHDDGVSLMLDNKLVSGFTSGPTPPLLESVHFTGGSGSHPFDLIYANSRCCAAWLEFFPYLY